MVANKGLRLVLVSLALAVSGCGVDPGADDGTTLGQQQDELTNSCTNSTNCSNCVYYARCRQPGLPYGLNTYQDKLNIINRYIPWPGCVAVIGTGTNIGHVAFVEYYNSYNGMVYISEGNWPAGQCGSRSGTASQLNIAGYWCP
jgi:hypothetical protein